MVHYNNKLVNISFKNLYYEINMISLSIQDKQRIKEKSKTLKDIILNQRQLCDLELLLNGGFYPLTGFMNSRTYYNVLNSLSLDSDGNQIFPIPVILDVNENIINELKLGQELCLRDSEYNLLAILKIEDIWKPNRYEECEKVYGSRDDVGHFGIDYILNHTEEYYIGGSLEGYQLPIHYDFMEYRLTPKEIKNKVGNKNVVAFQTRNPMHRSHQELTLKAKKDLGEDSLILIHPVVGMTKTGDIDHYTRVQAYLEILKTYNDNVMLSLLPLAMRMAGPREALWHAIIRRNYGCSHFIVGRDHAGPGKNKEGKDFYGPYDGQELVEKYQDKIGIKMLKYQMIVYLPEQDKYETVDKTGENDLCLNISGTELRHRLRTGKDIPEWFSYKNVVNVLRKSYPCKNKQGCCIFLTGLSGSGKSTIANALKVNLLSNNLNGRSVSLLDGDIIRKNLSSELGFSKEHRNLNIRRIGFVASEIVKSAGIVICASIAPYEESRRYARDLVQQYGGFIEIYVKTPLKTCEERDRKGLYTKARKGIIKGFTGIDDPYNKPLKPDIEIDTTGMDVKETIDIIKEYLNENEWL